MKNGAKNTLGKHLLPYQKMEKGYIFPWKIVKKNMGRYTINVGSWYTVSAPSVPTPEDYVGKWDNAFRYYSGWSIKSIKESDNHDWKKIPAIRWKFWRFD